VARRVLTESPMGVEYSFTTLGETLEAPITALYEWASKYSSDLWDAQKSFNAKWASVTSTTKSRSKTLVVQTGNQIAILAQRANTHLER
jgi:hypothetical protein